MFTMSNIKIIKLECNEWLYQEDSGGDTSLAMALLSRQLSFMHKILFTTEKEAMLRSEYKKIYNTGQIRIKIIKIQIFVVC